MRVQACITSTPFALIESERSGKFKRVLLVKQGLLSRKKLLLLGQLLAHL